VAQDERSEGLIDRDALGAWMDAQGLPGAGEPMDVRFIAGGASNEIFAIERGGSRLALRRPPRKVPKGRNETMLREYRVLSALRDSDVPHARALGVCEDTSVIGATFYVMEYVDGWSPINLEDRRWPAPFEADLGARKGLAYELVDAIAKLGQVDWRAAGLEGFGKPEGFLDRQVDRWLAHLSKFAFRELPGLTTAADWLRTHTPKHFTPGIIHGDYQFANVMFHHGAPARLAAVVDWEMATIGDPLLDLAWVLMTWPDEDERTDASAAKSYVDYAGMPDRFELMQRYARLSGLPVDAMDYYIVLGRFKMAIVLEQGYARFVQGGADNPKMQAFGDVVLDMAARAAQLARTSSL
jgi:aminoglycoside phosphotransferase (APT) family kinase protein